ncbi:bifunctional glycosyltransferase family 2/GtrA family protein [Nonomuraea sp. NBC_01738]|uniref:bifunctional glycosyltransferase family 2/GtrA family protein n=1 Tax=Nonomuraea sp. NBC_01738 TaxID=2976003 RepID=UPI002E14254D|nr:bifunctional glycosyltransferase family 2/GtrA family protein [Nonomuraea sp. NBC_01738]
MTISPVADIAIPVYNEEKVLPGTVDTLCAFLAERFPLPWRVTIVDNGSTDTTREVAWALAEKYPQVHVLCVDRRGKGAAVKEAWRQSPADVVAFMDADLSTGLDALWVLVATVTSGHSEIAIGTRLSGGARIHRALRRELISRGYNALLRVLFGARFSDAACGFKAARAVVVRPLLDKVEDDHWFFDTELLLLAQHNGARIREIPVDWVEDPDSSVNLWHTALSDLRGLRRLSRSMAVGTARVELPPIPPLPPSPPERKVVSFALVGLLSTVVHVLLYCLARQAFPVAAANLAALAATMVVNTEAHRRWTFNRAIHPVRRVHLRSMLVFLLNYLVTTGFILALPVTSLAGECLALMAGAFSIALIRYFLLNRWTFRPGAR